MLRAIILLSMLIVAVLVMDGYAQTYTIATQVISNGATNASNASYSLQGTMRQSAIRLTKSGGNQLQQGYWRYALTFYSCCIGIRGNVNNDEMQAVDVSDLSILSSYLSGGGVVLPCTLEADVNGSGTIDISDLSLLSSYLQGGTAPASCP